MQKLPLFFSAVCTVGMFCTYSIVAQAASERLFFEIAPYTTTSTNIRVSLKVDSDIPLNVYKFTVSYPNTFLKLQRVDLSNTLLRFVQADVENESSGTISLTGGSATSFEGSGGLLATIEFIPIAQGSGTFRVGDTALYAADGKGTLISGVTTKQSPITISAKAVAQAVSAEASSSPSASTAGATVPYITTARIIGDPVNSDQNFLVFELADDASGIKLVEVQTRTGFSWSDPISAHNPFPFPKNVWSVRLIVLDNQGNHAERVEYVWSTIFQFLGICILAVIVILALSWIVFGRRKSP